MGSSKPPRAVTAGARGVTADTAKRDALGGAKLLTDAAKIVSIAIPAGTFDELSSLCMKLCV